MARPTMSLSLYSFGVQRGVRRVNVEANREEWTEGMGGSNNWEASSEEGPGCAEEEEEGGGVRMEEDEGSSPRPLLLAALQSDRRNFLCGLYTSSWKEELPKLYC